ncbi:MAG TPA: TolC family protein, partial [Methylomirabilota bacterium]|nr:TolC family protein [Methylomirabilota bacterium]
MRKAAVAALLVLGAALASGPAAWGQAPGAPATPGTVDLARVTGRVLSLDEAIAIALEAQPQILARLGDYAAARYRVDQAFSFLLPQVTGSWTAARAQNVTGSPGTSQGTAATRTRTFWTDTTVARVTLSQLLFDFGKTFASTDAARRLAEVALEDVELQRQLITLAVKESFTNINFAQRLIRVNQQALERADLNLRSARGFFDVGTRPRSDVTRAEVDVANARLDVIRARNAEQVARVALTTAMGLPATTRLQIEDNLVFTAVDLDPAQLHAEALRLRPESRQARLRAEAAESTARRTFLDFFPDITGTGFYGAARPDMNEIWELGIGLSWSIFDGGSRIARYREARASL